MARGAEEPVARMANKHHVERFFDWYHRLAGDRRVMALTEDERGGDRWVVYCRNRRAADRLFDARWDQGANARAARARQSLAGAVGGQRGSYGTGTIGLPTLGC